MVVVFERAKLTQKGMKDGDTVGGLNYYSDCSDKFGFAIDTLNSETEMSHRGFHHLQFIYHHMIYIVYAPSQVSIIFVMVHLHMLVINHNCPS